MAQGSAVGAIAHFVFTETGMRLVPPSVPWPWAAAIASGVFGPVGAAGILLCSTRRASDNVTRRAAFAARP